MFVQAISQTAEMSEVLAMGIEGFDATAWQFRWRYVSVSGLWLAVVLFFGGLGLLRRRLWGWLWLGAGLSIAGLGVVALRLLTSGRFTFEPTLTSGIALLGSGVCFAHLYRKRSAEIRGSTLTETLSSKEFS